jgi:hypothetical protein
LAKGEAEQTDIKHNKMVVECSKFFGPRSLRFIHISLADGFVPLLITIPGFSLFRQQQVHLIIKYTITTSAIVIAKQLKTNPALTHAG